MRKTFRSIVIGLLLAVFATSSVSAEFADKDWRFLKVLSLPAETKANEPVELPIDRELLTRASIGLRDLRLIDDLEVETPYLVESLRGRASRSARSLQVFDRGNVVGSYSQMTVDFGAMETRHNQLELAGPSKAEFWREVEIESSQDNLAWVTVGTDEIYRISRSGVSDHSLRLEYPLSSARYLRIKILDEGSGELQMAGAVGYLDESVEPTLVSSGSLPAVNAVSAPDKTSIFEFDRIESGVPFHLLKISSSSTNFHRIVSVQVSNDREFWRTVSARSEIFSYAVGASPVNRFELTVPESTERYVRLVVFDQDSPPIDITEGQFDGYARRLVFLADPARSYSIYYGKNAVSAPVYDIGHVLNRVNTVDVPKVSVGPHQANPQYVLPVPPSEPASERLPWLIPLVIGIAASAVGFLLLSVLRKARSLAPPVD